MALSKDSKIALVLTSQSEVSTISSIFGGLGYRKTTPFVKALEAYEFLIRHQFDLLVVRMEMPDLAGIVLLQKLRSSGNYGEETVLFIIDRLEAGVANILFELDIRYVLTDTKDKNIIKEKISHLIQEENNLSPFELKYREARAALFNNLDEMAFSLGKELFELDPSNEKVCTLLGDIFAKHNDIKHMSRFYSQALKINPQSAIAANKLGYCYMQMGEYEKSAKLFKSLVDLNPYHLAMLENAGISHLKINKYEEALSYSSQISKLDESHKGATELSAGVYIAQGDYANMADVLKKTHGEREIISFLNAAGIKLAQESEVSEALKIYHYCVEHMKDNPYLYAVYFNIALAHLKLKNNEEAREALTQCLHLNPGFTKAQTYLDKLTKVA